MLLFALAVAGLVLAAAFAAAALKLTSPVSFLLGVYVLAVAQVVALTEILSLTRTVGPAGYLVGQAVVVPVALGAWVVVGRPLPRKPSLRVRSDPLLAALALVVTVAIIYSAFLAVATPPNNWDSMTYHLSRVAAWHQQGAVEYIDAAHTQRQNVYPPNGEMLILYTVSFLDRDTLAALPQLVAQLAAVIAVFGIAVRLGYGRRAAASAALITATLTQVAMQGVSTQNDLLLAALAATTAYFVLSLRTAELFVAGLAVGLMVGTKPTAVLVLPVLLLLAAVSLPARRVKTLVGASVGGVACVGAYGYLMNVVETGSPLGVTKASADLGPDAITAGGTVSTIARTTYRFLDFSGFHWGTSWTNAIARFAERASSLLHIPPNPPESTSRTFYFDVNVSADWDLSFFGPLGVLLVLPLAIGFSVAWAFGRTTARRGALSLALPFAILGIALLYRYNDFVGRFLVAAVVLTMPLAACVYRRRAVFVCVAALAGASLVLAQLTNVAKPTGIRGTTPIWRLSRPEAQGLTREGMAATIATIERTIPPNARLGVVLGEDDWDYPLYGERFERRLVALRSPQALEEAVAAGLQWIVTGSGERLTPPEGWTSVVVRESGWTILRNR